MEYRRLGRSGFEVSVLDRPDDDLMKRIKAATRDGS
jgi:hypothetical protein